ncbi:MAG: arylsulfatase [Planctomycetota bacterium]|nr:arylsulfatase [Planctomycetota bacterium]
MIACHFSLSSFAAETPPRPNIILIMTDDQGYAPLGRHGHPWIKTPHLDRLYDQSTRLTRFLVSPTCSPTRSALMTGRHPMRNGVTHTILERERLTLNATTLPQVLKQAGYTTGIFGKWHLGDEEPYQPHNRGFDETFIHGAGGIGQTFECSCADAPGNGYFDPVIRHNGTFVRTKGFCTDTFFRAALGWIHSVKEGEQPFFTYLVTNAPHGPFIAPPKYADRFKKLGFEDNPAGYYGMIENIDDNIGLLLDRLDEWNLADNTLLIFLSDNGMVSAGSYNNNKPYAEGYPFYNAGMKGLKGSVDEGGVRVPAFFRWPGKIKSNHDLDQVTAHIDIFPTLVELAGAIRPANQVQGRSLLPLLLDTSNDWPDRNLVSHFGRWTKGEDPNLSKWKTFAVRNHRFRLVGKDELYDMQADPGQTTNVIDKHPDVVKAMLEYYDRWWDETVPMMVNESTPNSLTQPFHELYELQNSLELITDWVPPEL